MAVGSLVPVNTTIQSLSGSSFHHFRPVVVFLSKTVMHKMQNERQGFLLQIGFINLKLLFKLLFKFSYTAFLNLSIPLYFISINFEILIENCSAECCYN